MSGAQKQYKLKPVDKVEIWTLQDNYIEITAMDNSAVVTRATALKDGEIKASVNHDMRITTM